jgi:hypothetical protein
MPLHLAVPIPHASRSATRKASLVVSAALIGLLLGSSPASAQDSAEESPKHSLRPGAWALEFDVRPSLSGSFGAAGIAAKRHFTTRSALRFGFLVGISGADAEGERTVDRAFPYDTTQTTGEIEAYTDRRDVSLFLHLSRFLGVRDRFGVILEAGPTARWISEEFGYVDVYPAPQGTYRRAGDRDSWSYGWDMVAGFEWFFSRRLSLAGRFGATALLTDTDQTEAYEFYNPNDGYWDRRLDTTHSEGFSVQTTATVISFTAYF